MRKSLLITSALGLVATALPTLAMANAAAAGSSSAVCGSGFFAQFDAKIMNAKLEIKNEKGNKSTVPENEEEDANKIIEVAANDLLAQIVDADIDTLFQYADGVDAANKLHFITDLLDLASVENLRKDVAKEIGRVVPLSLNGRGADGAVPLNVGTSAEKAAALRVVGRALIAPTVTDLEAAVVFDKVVGDITKLLNAINPTIKKGTLGDAIVSASLVQIRNDREAEIAIASDILDDAKLFRSFYKKAKGGKLLLVNTAAAAQVNAGYITALKDAIKTDAPAKVDIVKGSPIISQYARTSAEDNAKLNAQYKELKTFDRIDQRVHHHALAGGVGATVGWWQNLGGFALSISGSGDYLWGTFRTVDDAAGSTVKAEDKRRLGFGFQGDIGAHYIVSPSTTLGILIGLRGQQLNFGRINTAANQTANSKDSKGDYASKWMINPVVSAQMRTFFTDNVYGALSVGYVIPMEKDYKLENTKIDKEAKIRFQGLTGAFSVGMMF